MGNLSLAFIDAQALLNDVGKAMWPDTTLQAYVPKAHKELQVKLWRLGLPVIKEVSAVKTITASSTSMGSDLPSDILEPSRMFERAVGDTDFIPMKELSELPAGEEATETLRYWCWREEVIEFVGATENRQVQLDYIKGITIPTGASSSIGFIMGELYLGPRIAALAAGSLGNTSLYLALTQDANVWLDEIFGANVKGMQGLGSRRIPYRRGGSTGRIS